MVKADAYSIQDPYLQYCRVASRYALVNGIQGWPHVTVCHPKPHNIWGYYNVTGRLGSFELLLLTLHSSLAFLAV